MLHTPNSYVVISKFRVANGMAAEVREAFINRPHKVDSADGFIRMEVLRPQGLPEEFWLITHWRDKESFENWHQGHSYKDSHSGIPAGLKLTSEVTEIRHFEMIAS